MCSLAKAQASELLEKRSMNSKHSLVQPLNSKGVNAKELLDKRKENSWRKGLYNSLMKGVCFNIPWEKGIGHSNMTTRPWKKNCARWAGWNLGGLSSVSPCQKGYIWSLTSPCQKGVGHKCICRCLWSLCTRVLNPLDLKRKRKQGRGKKQKNKERVDKEKE